MAPTRSILQNYSEIAEPNIKAQQLFTKSKSPFPPEVSQLAYLSYHVIEMWKLGKEIPRFYKNITKTTANITWSRCLPFKTGMWYSDNTKVCTDPKSEDDFILNSLDYIFFLLPTSYTCWPFPHSLRSSFLFNPWALDRQETLSSISFRENFSKEAGV